MKLIVIEGCDGTGTTTHTESLVYALVEAGHPAIGFTHGPPAVDCSPWTRAVHYANERARMVDRFGKMDVVVVADRWWHSTLTFAHGCDAPTRNRLQMLVRMEKLALPTPVLVALLDAPDHELDARLTKRGEALRPVDLTYRQAYRTEVAPMSNTVLDTSHPKNLTRESLLQASLAALWA